MHACSDHMHACSECICMSKPCEWMCITSHRLIINKHAELTGWGKVEMVDEEDDDEVVEPDVPPPTAEQRVIMARVSASVKALAMHFLEVMCLCVCMCV